MFFVRVAPYAYAEDRRRVRLPRDEVLESVAAPGILFVLTQIYDTAERAGGLMASDTQVRAVVDAIYRAAVEPDTWSQTITSLADVFESTTGGFAYGHRQGGGGISLFVRSDPAWERSYNEYYSHRNPYQHGVHLIREGFVAAGHVFLRDDELLKTEYYADFLAKHDVFYSVGAFPVVQGDTAATVLFYRPRRRRPFGRDEVGLLRLLSPHFAQAITIHRRLTSQSQPVAAAEALTSELPFGVIVFDSGGHIRLLNALAERILSLRDGIGLSRGEVKALDPRVQAELLRCVRSATMPLTDALTPRGGTVIIPRPSQLRPFRLSIFPLDLVSRSGERGAVGFVSDLESRPRLSLEGLRMSLGLTPREATLVAGLMSGDDLRAFSQRASIAFDTARTHLKSIFNKTGVRSQSELVSLVLRIPGLSRLDQGVVPEG